MHTQFNQTLDVEDGTIGLYAQGSTSPKAGAVVIVQEIFGVNPTIRSTVDSFAAQGFRAVAPDLFWRQRAGTDLDPDQPDSRPVAMALARGYRNSLETNLTDLAALITHLRGAHQKVGIVGYCLGGQAAFHAWLTLDVDAAVSYYGTGIETALGRVDGQRTPLLMHLGATDPLNPPPVQEAIVAALSHLENVTTRIHPDVGHAFARPNSQSYVATAATTANTSTYAFLHEHLD
jgi:carboxymethylenebutenolidase